MLSSSIAMANAWKRRLVFVASSLSGGIIEGLCFNKGPVGAVDVRRLHNVDRVSRRYLVWSSEWIPDAS